VGKEMSKIGILSFNHLKDRISIGGGGDDSNLLFKAPRTTIGYRYVIGEAAKYHDIEYVDTDDTESDYWLASLLSWYDVYNLIRALKGRKPKAKLIIGGPGVLNPWIFQDLIYAAVIGRGEGIINRVIDGDKTVPNVYYSDEPGRMITIGQPTIQIDGGSEREFSCGCPKKCFFCEYGWKYKYVNWEGQYREYANGETFFKDIDFSRGRITAGLDGLTEYERYIVNKELSSEEIIDTLAKHTIRDNAVLKLYCITAYPFTDGYDFVEWEDTLARASKVVRKPITIMLSLSHFCPMPFTPMEDERVTFHERILQAPKRIGLIKWGTYLQGTTVASAAYEAMIYRARPDDNIIRFILENKPGKDTAVRIHEVFPHVIDGGYVPLPLIRRQFNTEVGKRLYRQRIESGKYLIRHNCI